MSTEHEPRVPEQLFPRIFGLPYNLSQQPNSFPTTLLPQLPAKSSSDSHAWNRLGGC
jgi:hypothetical protein